MPSSGNTEPRIDIATIGPRGLPPGEVIPGSRYRVIAQIGKGGMGLVYEAEHIDLKKRVAVKVLLSSSTSDTKRVAAFLREAQTASRISSQYIADVTDFGQLPDGRVYFVMQFVEGQSLGKLLRSGQVFPVERALPILRQMAKALQETHRKGVAHLDVKPDNIMLVDGAARPDSVKMVDFGIAGLLEDARSGAKSISGTPEYVSPERIQARPYDQRSDVYSLGVVAYELLTGAAPFHGDDAVKTLKQHVEMGVPAMSQRAPGQSCPAAVEKVVNQLLAKDPAERPADMATVEALLCEAQIYVGLTTAWDDLELPAVEEQWRRSLAERMPSPGGRRRKIVMTVAACAALLGGSLALYYGVYREPEIIIREIRVEGATTREAAEVAAWIVRAQQAVRRQLYVVPLGDSALDYIERGEAKAVELGTQSPGAQILREASASALLAMGTEMEQVELHDLALIKYREALRFLPSDPELRSRSQLSPEEEKLFTDRAAWQRARGDDAGGRNENRARQVAADLFQAARKGRDSEARVLQRQLEQLDPGGMRQATLADGLRKVASVSWGSGKQDQARSVYKVISKLDPEDRAAAVRADDPEIAAAPAHTIQPDPEIPPEPPAIPEPPAQKKARMPELEALKNDPRAAARLVAEGKALARSVRLADASKAFESALALDARNHAAYSGLAEVHFEQAHYEDALSYARRAVTLAPRSVPYKLLLGDCYYKLFRYDQAHDIWQAAQRLAPGNRELMRRLQDVNKKR